MTIVETRVGPCGAIRRVQALIARGFTPAQIAGVCETISDYPITPLTVSNLAYLHARKVGEGAGRAIRQAYELMDDEDPPAGSRPGVIHEAARLREWLPPEGWVGVDMDDPYAFPTNEPDPVDFAIAADAARRGDTDGIRRALPCYEHRLELALHLERLLIDEGEESRHQVIGKIDAAPSDLPDYEQRHASWIMKQARAYETKRRACEAIRPDGPVMLLVTGSRRADAPHINQIWQWMAEELGSRRDRHAVMHGGADGVDAIANLVAQDLLQVPVLRRPARWKDPCRPECFGRGKGGKSHRRKRYGSDYCPLAGHYRNADMVHETLRLTREHPDVTARCLAVYVREQSAGTRHCLTTARDAGMITIRRLIRGDQP